ncbi:MAG: hypothetical protein CMJ33_00995 [Phycisphaerae bacterium]|nr:hypothetical protein [Phycisphaerae bacterium]
MGKRTWNHEESRHAFMTEPKRTTRLAPSPTGPLHLGNARSLLLCWAIGRARDWRVLLRMEDLDGERCTLESESMILEDLHWLGLDWDDEMIRQSDDVERHRRALQTASEAGTIFQCARSRKDLRETSEALNAPHEGGPKARSTYEMRPDHRTSYRFMPGEHNHRATIAPGPLIIEDEIVGRYECDPLDIFGDPIVWTRRDTPSYQLAVVLDDAHHGVTDVIRGEDLLPSAALQTRLAELFGVPSPRWWHVPLLRNHEGRRLAKRDEDETLSQMRARGIPKHNVIQHLSASCGMNEPYPATAREFAEQIDHESIITWSKKLRLDGGDRLPEDFEDRLKEPP